MDILHEDEEVTFFKPISNDEWSDMPGYAQLGHLDT